MSAENLMKVWEQAIASEKAEAMESYFRYHRLMQAIAAESGVSAPTACAVFSALSPNNDYIGNLKDTRRLLNHSTRINGRIEDFKVTTYHNNKRKAWDIARGVKSPEQAIVALKTWNFFNNVATPERTEFVTIDGHMYWAWMGRNGGVKGDRKNNAVKLPGASVTPRIYQAIASDVRALATALNVLPNQFQAVCWVTWKRIHRKKYSSQMELLASDEIAAGIIRL
jgi:hypothetical protein